MISIFCFMALCQRLRSVPQFLLVLLCVAAAPLWSGDSVIVTVTGPTLDEGNLGLTQVLHVRLSSQPTAGQVVVVNLASDTAKGVTLSAASLTFTNANWSTQQNVTVTAV
ncbi:MAG TPA: hypothetical protein VL860_15425, partial [Planctomycetota bacterium]|nr:hypothetical protein [Planctomycetota bacterium]